MDFVTGSRVPRAKYTMVREALCYMIPYHMQCSMGCGGPACKYEDPSHWSEDDQAIRGIYSSWITENLLAMARPSTEIIERFDVIDQFLRCGLKTVINLQCPGEHASCGNPLDPESGFTYRPETFMEAGIYFYNFRWNDYGVASLTSILDMVKVMSFAVQEGKLAVHCHAGLGRTGVLLACFLLFTTQMTADQAILLVRSKRPNSIQTRGQLQCVRQFARFLVPLRNVFANVESRVPPVSLSQYLIRQKHILHGYEARKLRYMPKLIPLICRLLLDIAENRQVIEEDVVEVPDVTPMAEKSFNESSVYQLNREILGNGMTMIQPRLPGLPNRANRDNTQPLYYVRKSLSYSESDLQRLAASLNLSDNPLSVLASIHSTDISNQLGAFNCVSQNYIIPSLGTCKDNPIYSSTSNIWELKTLMDQTEGSPLLKNRRQSVLLRSQSLIVSDDKSTTSIARILSYWRRDCTQNTHPDKAQHNEKEHSEVPFITVQSELSLESRRLLVAQSLAVDLENDGDKEQIQKVSTWQEDLNCQGAWERLCLEKDPFILSGIMWSWLEQLKDPVISTHDVHTLKEANQDPETVLNCLDRASKETGMCILDCFARLLIIPEEVESAFLDRAAKALTKMKNTDGGKSVHEIMKGVLKLVLHHLRLAAINEFEV
ncbi:protein tyrosine phosphatase domain-containing protein 1 isoform X2 [Puntigrus tetrazona]|nr:protein tyrosine phosphatase domain-containing protein 1 isoform X2 [Puntigrus tetrazona]